MKTIIMTLTETRSYKMILVTNDKFHSIIGPIETTNHGSCSRHIEGEWVHMWQLKTKAGVMVGFSIENDHYINSEFLK